MTSKDAAPDTSATEGKMVVVPEEVAAAILQLVSDLNRAFYDDAGQQAFGSTHISPRTISQDRAEMFLVLGALSAFMEKALPAFIDIESTEESRLNLQLGHPSARKAISRLAMGLKDLEQGVRIDIFEPTRQTRPPESSFLWGHRADICAAVDAVMQDSVSPSEAAKLIVRRHSALISRFAGSRSGRQQERHPDGALSDDELAKLVLGWRARLNSGDKVPSHAAERYRLLVKDIRLYVRPGQGLMWASLPLISMIVQAPIARF